MFTEDEARKKDCRVSGMMEVKKNLGAVIFPRCIASGCMGWVATQFPIAATYSPVTGRLITLEQPGRGRCGYTR